ncbi:MAG: MTH938/NDUFAF3 family protein [Chloroflexi bacterium]|nr:MTH938/NDUFAF3 family protein [Chloroflexota bacterium]
MKPHINSTSFGSITVAGEEYSHDILIRLDGTVSKRKKKLSKEIYGTSHVISLAEAEYVYEEGVEILIIGSGQSDQVRLSDEAKRYLKEKKVEAVLTRTDKAIKLWNEAQGKAIGLFHITC